MNHEKHEIHEKMKPGSSICFISEMLKSSRGSKQGEAIERRSRYLVFGAGVEGEAIFLDGEAGTTDKPTRDLSGFTRPSHEAMNKYLTPIS